MIEFLNSTILEFRSCFTRKKAFQWFTIVIIGLMLCPDTLGVTSFIRELNLNPNVYTTFIHFFRSTAWNLESIRKKWISIIMMVGCAAKVCEMYVLIGDGIKVSKEGIKMPAVKKLHQESANSGKSEYIFGHLFGVIGILSGSASKLFSIPLIASIQDGDEVIRTFTERQPEEVSHVVQIIRDAGMIAKQIGASILLADRYFLSEPALKEAARYTNDTGEMLLQVVTKAKLSTVAYLDPKPYSGRGRPETIGKRVKLKTLFQTSRNQFAKNHVYMYGRMQEVLYYSVDLAWGRELHQKLRFVLIEMNGIQSILASTSMSLSPLQIIEMYSYRFKIEVSFNALKHSISGFMYHFWSKHMPKLDKYSKEKNTDALLSITDPNSKRLIFGALRAIEGFVCFSAISLGLLQIIALNFSDEAEKLAPRYLRTKSKHISSEATIAFSLRKSIFLIIHKYSHLTIMQIIRSKQCLTFFDSQDSA